ncbi:T9SS type A sorting domain-containing protein, partial [Balneolaceae bacterium ANBcel3]|nr:T9SS type A sorting domain-containing protein [Balneolaceae bacterium ANBcel3]
FSNSDTSLDLNAVDFVDENNGLAVGGRGIVLRTRNGGSSWVNRRNPNVRIFNDLQLLDDQRAWAVDADGYILYSDDLADSWRWASTRSGGSLNSLFITESGEGWAVGRDGAVLRNTDASSIPTTAIVEERAVPEGVHLQQNYPNPFNPATNISFELNHTADVTLKVYDITGRMVSELANGRYGQGIHTVSFDAAHLSSGVYIYQLQTNGRTLSRAMTLVK